VQVFLYFEEFALAQTFLLALKKIRLPNYSQSLLLRVSCCEAYLSYTLQDYSTSFESLLPYYLNVISDASCNVILNSYLSLLCNVSMCCGKFEITGLCLYNKMLYNKLLSEKNRQDLLLNLLAICYRVKKQSYFDLKLAI